MCISETFSELRQHDLAREKLVSKLLFSIQAFAYSCCSEAAEIRRLYSSKCEEAQDNNSASSQQQILSKFGVKSIICDQLLICMPEPTLEEEGSQPFDGRLGKLRYLGLSVMVASSAVAKEIMQLAFSFPDCQRDANSRSSVMDGMDIHRNSGSKKSACNENNESRAPLVYPILCSNVFTHTVAAMSAICGQSRREDDSVFVVSSEEDDAELARQHINVSGNISNDCENVIKLGLLGRVLQVLLGSMGITGLAITIDDRMDDANKITRLLKAVDLCWEKKDIKSFGDDFSMDQYMWIRGCCQLIYASLRKTSTLVRQGAGWKYSSRTPEEEKKLQITFIEACMFAQKVGESFLSDAALVLQLLIPGVAAEARHITREDHKTGVEHSREKEMSTIKKLAQWLRIETMSEMLKSSFVCDLVSWWYEEAAMKGRTAQNKAMNSLELALDCKRVFQAWDWPLNFWDVDLSPPNTFALNNSNMTIVGIQSAVDSSLSSTNLQSKSKKIANASPISNKCVPLFGGYCLFCNINEDNASASIIPRIKHLPTSYTDLYAQLGALCPESEQTALCLVCGAVLNANGKGECTEHAMKCGGGAGIFFLLQECFGLILHGKDAAYVHSPYVDSHGETPQFRGRPLNLDLDRYEILKELWVGHLVRERVTTERVNLRQVIIANFY